MLLKDLKLRVFPQRFLTRSLIRRLPEDRRVLPHVADFVALGSLEELRVGFDRAQIRDGEILFADHWTSANRKQIDGKFLGMPSLIHRGERLIIAHDAYINDVRLASADRIYTGDDFGSQILNRHVILDNRPIWNWFAPLGCG